MKGGVEFVQWVSLRWVCRRVVATPRIHFDVLRGGRHVDARTYAPWRRRGDEH